MTDALTSAASSERFSIGALELPVRYTDGAAFACIYRVPFEEARAVVASELVEPLSELSERLRTVVPVRHKLRMGGARSVRVQVTGRGPTAESVRRLGLEYRHPLMAARVDHLDFELPRAVPVAPRPVRID